MNLPRLILAGIITITIVLGVPPTASSAAPGDIHPGVQTFTEGAQCTANFVFTDGFDTYIGQAAHCSGTGAANETNGCDAGSHPIGTEVEIDGASAPGTMVYNSWLTMQSVRETNEDACWNNDFALVKVAEVDEASVDPTIPFWGGPECINTDGTAFGETVYSYGNSSLRFGLTVLSPKDGYSLGSQANGWTHPVYTVTPGIPGDSGSAFLDSNGCALGVLSTLSAAPFPASNYVSDIHRALQYMYAHTNLDGVQLVQGGAFTG